jgi:hypothetical protein
MIRIRGKRVSGGKAEGRALVTREPITFLGGVDPETGLIVERGHELEGKSIKNKILIFPRGKGSTVGSYVLYQMRKNGTAPGAIVNLEAEEIVAVGAIISGIPMLHSLERNPYSILKTGAKVRLNADRGYLEVE